MQAPQNLFFTPNPTTHYKIVSVLDQKKAFTVQQFTQKIIVNDYNGAHSQLFKIIQNNHKYAFVNPISNSAIRIQGENKYEGAPLKVDPNSFQSNFIQIVPVTKGQWSIKSCHLMTFANGLTLDLKGGKAMPNTEVCTTKFSGNNSQQWLVVPAENIQKLPPPPPAQSTNAYSNQSISQPPAKTEVKTGQQPQPMNPPKVEQKQQQKIHEDVPAIFQPKAGTAYKILSLVDDSKGLTVSNDKKLHINTHKGQISQKFNMYPDKSGKVALVACSNNSGLCVLKNDKDNNAQIITDSDKMDSSWFTIARADKGKYANKGYLIKTFVGNKALQITGGKPEEGKNIVQFDIHQGEAQLWLFDIFEDPKMNKKDSKKDDKKDVAKKQSPTGNQKTPETPTPKIVVTPGTTPTPGFTPGVTPTKGGFAWNAQLDKALSLVPQSQVTPGGQGMNFIQFAQFKPNQTYALYPVHSNMKNSLDISADKHLIMNTFNGQPNQKFIFQLEGNMYRIKNMKENKYLNLVNDDQKDGIAVKCEDKGTAKSQYWAVLPTSDAKYAGKGAYHIRTIFGKTLETPANKLDNNVKIQQGPYTGADGQTWVIKEI